MLLFAYWWSSESISVCKCDKDAIRERIGKVCNAYELHLAFETSMSYAGTNGFCGDTNHAYIYVGF